MNGYGLHETNPLDLICVIIIYFFFGFSCGLPYRRGLRDACSYLQTHEAIAVAGQQRVPGFNALLHLILIVLSAGVASPGEICKKLRHCNVLVDV